MEPINYKNCFVIANGIRLHYLDWEGEGPVLLFLTGMGCSAYIFREFAARFTDNFRVIVLDRRGHGDSDFPLSGYDADTLTEDLKQFLDALGVDQVTLVGHSMGYLELSRFAVLYPERVHKLVFLDGAYENGYHSNQAVWDQNPLPKISSAWPDYHPDTIEDYIAAFKWANPALAVLWCPAMDEQTRHTVKINPDGKVVTRMSAAISSAIAETFASYRPEYTRIQAPVLSFYSIRDGSDYLSTDRMTVEQQMQVRHFFTNVLSPHQKQYIDKFRQALPHAQIVEIPKGHHYCFIKQASLVYNAMRKFLLDQ